MPGVSVSPLPAVSYPVHPASTKARAVIAVITVVMRWDVSGIAAIHSSFRSRKLFPSFVNPDRPSDKRNPSTHRYPTSIARALRDNTVRRGGDEAALRVGRVKEEGRG